MTGPRHLSKELNERFVYMSDLPVQIYIAFLKSIVPKSALGGKSGVQSKFFLKQPWGPKHFKGPRQANRFQNALQNRTVKSDV